MKQKQEKNGRISWLLGGLFGLLTAGVVVAIDSLAATFAGLPRLTFSLFDWLARVLPGGIITIGIQSMVSTITRLNLGQTSSVAKQAEQASAVAMFLGIGAVFGVILALIQRSGRFDVRRAGLIGGALLGILFVLVFASLGFSGGNPMLVAFWTLVLLTAWGWFLAETIYMAAPAPRPATAVDLNRRRFLWIAGAGSLTVLVSAAGISILTNQKVIPQTGSNQAGEDLSMAANTSGPAQSPPQSDLSSRFPPVAGTRPELTANADFYRIDINTTVPSIDGNTWRLDFGGMVDKPLNLSLADLRARPAFSQAVTQECISNPLGGDLISTTVYTGARLKDILADAGVKDGARAIYVESADGFYESIPIEEAMDERTLLAYAMNGEPLPEEHGFPLRVTIPNHFGMKQPKWILKMTVSDSLKPGYWVDRGWNEKAVPPVTSVIDSADAANRDPQSGRIPVGGVAFAGDRGIQKVEVQVDDGPWEEAELRDPPLSPLTWVLWRYLWDAKPGVHTLHVRATDGQGTLQTTEVAPPEPDGATGIFSIKENII